MPPQAQHRTAADAGQILQQAHTAKEQSSQQRCEQPDREQALGPQQLRLSHTGGCPAHAHSSQHPHHQAEPAHGGGLRRALRLASGASCLGDGACRALLIPASLERPQQRHHQIPERRREEEP